MNRCATQKQTDAENERAYWIETVRGAWPGAWQRMEVHVGDQQNKKKIRLGQEKKADSDFGLVRHRILGGVIRYSLVPYRRIFRHLRVPQFRLARQFHHHFVGAIGMGEIPQRPPTPNR